MDSFWIDHRIFFCRSTIWYFFWIDHGFFFWIDHGFFFLDRPWNFFLDRSWIFSGSTMTLFWIDSVGTVSLTATAMGVAYSAPLCPLLVCHPQKSVTGWVGRKPQLYMQCHIFARKIALVNVALIARCWLAIADSHITGEWTKMCNAMIYYLLAQAKHCSAWFVGVGVTPPPLVPLDPQVFIDPRWFSQKYITGPLWFYHAQIE